MFRIRPKVPVMSLAVFEDLAPERTFQTRPPPGRQHPHTTTPGGTWSTTSAPSSTAVPARHWPNNAAVAVPPPPAGISAPNGIWATTRTAGISPERNGSSSPTSSPDDDRIWAAVRLPTGRYQVRGDYSHTYDATDLDFLGDHAATASTGLVAFLRDLLDTEGLRCAV